MITSENMIKPPSVFDAEHRMLTLGIVLGVTLYAFEGLAIVTVAPRFAEALGGMALYGWVFSSFLLASLLGIVISGQMSDKHGVTRPLALSLVFFGVGLLLSGFAPNMLTLITGRVLQGLGGGALGTTLYVVVNLAFADALRPRMMALMSTAWVVPALIGPAAAGLLAETVGWRFVFWGMVPLISLVALLTLPAFKKLEQQRTVKQDSAKQDTTKSDNRLSAAFQLVIGTGFVLAALSFQQIIWVLLGVITGGFLLISALKKLTPKGMLSLQSGLPAVVASRGLFYAAFVGVETFLALMLTSIHGFSSTMTGLAIATGAISWTLGSWLQERLDTRLAGRARPTRVIAGASILALGLSLQLFALYTTALPLVITLMGWSLSGFGIGLAHATTSVLAFSLAKEGEEGAVSSALQLSDQFCAAMSTGVGGALFALAIHLNLSEQQGILFAFMFSIAVVLLSVVAAIRIAGWQAEGARVARA